MDKHYDVVVLGAGLGALATAALLARRSWRVLVLGQGYRPASYSYEGLPLARRPFTFLTSSSPAWTRIVAELAQSQTFRRRVTPLDPMFQVLSPGRRLDMPPEAERFGMEIDREFPGVRRIIDDLMQELARANAAVDTAFERDVVWPPGTFWERRETASALAMLPHLPRDRRHEAPADLLAEFPREHPYRTVAEVPARFSSDAYPPLSSLALARLSGAWTRGVMELARGEEELVDFLVERITAHGGAVELGDRAVAIVHGGGKVRGVLIDGD
ncbi:MAG: NAD(P)-binding protein, partial [Polyangiaceae bacterium]